MKKKFITGLLLMAVTATGFSTFTSCKDTEDDLRAELQGSNATLNADLKALQEELKKHQQQNVTDIEALKTQISGKITSTEAEELIKKLTNKYAETATVNSLIDGLQKQIDALGTCDKNPFTPEQVAALIGLAGQAQDLATLLETVNGKDGADGLSAKLAKLETQINGEGGLASQVAGLDKWFENIGLTPEQFQDYVKQGLFVKNNHDALQKLVELQNANVFDKEALEALNGMKGDLAGIDNMYNAIFKGVEAPEDGWWNYATVMDNIKKNSAAIAVLQKDVDSILGRINDMVTSLLLQATTNPVFGSVNTPFGVNSMVLMSYYGKLATDLRQFPAIGVGAEYNGKDVDVDWEALTKGKFYDLQNENIISLDENGNASLGNLWFTVNPGTVNNLDLNGFALVNSKEEVAKVSLTNIVKDDETDFKFGISSRAAGNGNGLYRATASVAPEDLDAIKINIEPGLKDALIDAVKNHTATDIAHMLKAIYNQLQNICDANALRYTWTSKDVKDAQGNWLTRENKVYSNYGLAATAFKPLSFATLYGESFRQIPTISPIEINKDLVDLDLGTFEVDSKNFALNLNFGEPQFTPLGKVTINTTVTLKDQTTGNIVSGPIEIDITDKAQEIQDNITSAIENWIGKGDNSLDARVEKSIWYALFNDKNAKDPKYPYDPTLPTGVVADLTAQVNDMMGSIQDKLDNLVDKVNKDYLGKVNSLINKVNSVSARINKILADPNHYLQATMLYKNASNQLGLLSTNPKQPSQFKGNGEAIELWATTYNFETLCPVFKKFVGVTKVTDKNGTEVPALAEAANKSANFMGEVVNGDVNRVVLDVKGATAGVYTYEIAYQALDFTGHTSTVKCYVQVVR